MEIAFKEIIFTKYAELILCLDNKKWIGITSMRAFIPLVKYFQMTKLKDFSNIF